MLDENHMGWKLLSGVRLDVINLLKSFSSTNSLRYEDFCQVWKKMNFSLIFKHRVTFIEVLEFTEELLLIVKEYLSSVYECQTRIAALYALYGLYFKQPLKGAAKIRFTKPEWEELYSLMEECKSEGHYDVVFIYLKLLLSGAYTFAATLRPAGLEQGFRKYSEKKFYSKNCDLQLFYRPIISESLIRSLVSLESLYCEKKSELLGEKNLVFIDGKFAQTVQEELKNYESSLQIQYSKKANTNVEGKNNEEPTEFNSEGTSRKLGDKSKIETNHELPVKRKNKSSKKSMGLTKRYQELTAMKKAEYYIQKLQEESSQQRGIREKFVNLELPCPDSELSDSSE